LGFVHRGHDADDALGFLPVGEHAVVAAGELQVVIDRLLLDRVGR
jgi:hypothetical protein